MVGVQGRCGRESWVLVGRHNTGPPGNNFNALSRSTNALASRPLMNSNSTRVDKCVARLTVESGESLGASSGVSNQLAWGRTSSNVEKDRMGELRS